MARVLSWGLCALLSVILPTAALEAAATNSNPANVTAKRLLNATSEPSQWMTYGGSYNEQRYSRLTQINKNNVKDLGLSWYVDLDSNLSQDSTPLYIDGVLYVTTPWSIVYAYDASTGKEIWRFDPKTPREWARKVCCGLVTRGIAAWNGKIYTGTLDAKLTAIDAKTGKQVWSTLTLDKSRMDNPTERYSITMAPRVVNGMVLVGNSGSEFGVRGYVSAYDAETGKLLWRFYTVPGNPADGFENKQMKMAAKTWSGDWWKVGGGGTVWDGLVYDQVNDLVIFGTGNGTPWNQLYRDPGHGDNLFITSIIAVKPKTGKYVWHYQETPGDSWDFDATTPLTLANLTVDGKKRRVVMQASKNGFFYMLDAASGKLLRAQPFTEVNWADGVDMKTGRPRVKPGARYEKKPFNMLPGVQGAHGWHPNAFDPKTGLLYIATQHAYMPMVTDPNFQVSAVGFNLGINFGSSFTYYRDHPDEPSGFTGYLQAWDPIAGKTVWRGQNNQGPTGAVLATASGLVFQGGGTDEEFRAYDAGNGKKLWSMNAQAAVLAPAISYELDGKQYVTLSVGGNKTGGYYAPNYSRLLVFSLGGKEKLPPNKPFTPRPLDPPSATASADVVKAGESRYSQYCAICHGDQGQSRGSAAPNLTRTPLLHTQEGFDAVVLKGALVQRGMGNFSDALQPADTQAIRAYIISRANQLKNAPPPGPPRGRQVQQPHEEQD